MELSQERVYIYMRSFEGCICLCVRNFECPEATLLSWQDVKIELQTPIQDHCAAFFQPVTTTTLGMAAPRCVAIARTIAHATRHLATASMAALMATAVTTAALVSFLYWSWHLLCPWVGGDNGFLFYLNFCFRHCDIMCLLYLRWREWVLFLFYFFNFISVTTVSLVS